MRLINLHVHYIEVKIEATFRDIIRKIASLEGL